MKVTSYNSQKAVYDRYVLTTKDGKRFFVESAKDLLGEELFYDIRDGELNDELDGETIDEIERVVGEFANRLREKSTRDEVNKECEARGIDPVKLDYDQPE